ncbi:MAG: F0F1 ATP synthase subunit delta [Bacillota bacterium]|nr:F0F1 ATP synthase subunit delta [Bacillota bacterium]
MSVISSRYAEALFMLAKQENAVSEYQEDLTVVAGIYSCENKLREFLLCPRSSVYEKKQLVEDVFRGKTDSNVINFLKLLLDKSRISYLPEICTDFVKFADREKNVLNITIFTAAELEQDYVDAIRNKFKNHYEADDCRADIKNDPTLIGGVKVAVGDKLYDATINGNLKKLLSEMTV